LSKRRASAAPFPGPTPTTAQTGFTAPSLAEAALDVAVDDVQRVVLDENAARLDFVAHQAAEKIVGVVGLLDLDLQQRARFRIERGFPELVGIHFAEAFVA